MHIWFIYHITAPILFEVILQFFHVFPPPGSLQTMTPSAYTLRSQRQPEPMPFHSSPKWTLAKVTENKYHFPFESDSRDSGVFE